MTGEMNRRTLLQRTGAVGAAAGVAWVAPTVLSLDAASAWGSCAAAISPFPLTTATTDSSGWTRSITAGAFEPGNPYSGTHGLLGISTAYLGLGPCFLSENDPTVLAGGVATLTYTTSINVVSGLYYRFSFRAVCTAQNIGPQILDVLVGGATQVLVAPSTAGVGLPTTFTTDNSNPGLGAGRTLVPNGRPGAADPLGSNPGVSQPPGTYRFVFLATSTGAVNFQYRFTLNTLRGSSPAKPSDDIAVSAPTIECSTTGA